MAVDIATLGLKVESAPVVKATEALDRLAQSATRAERAAQDFNRGQASASAGTRQLARDLDDATRGANSFGAAFARGLGRGVIMAAVAGAGAAVLSITREVAGLGDTARKTGLDLQRLQELRIGGQMQGIAAPKIDASLDALASKLNEARQSENDLTRLLDENNVRYKSRTGEIISTNQALEEAANLISRAATEQDKIKIAEAFGLPRDFVPMLEKGVAGLEAAGRAARESGGIIDAELVARAAGFDRAWTAAVASWSATAKANIMGVAGSLADLAAKASEFLGGLGNADVIKRLNRAMGVSQDESRAFAEARGWSLATDRQMIGPKPFDANRFNMEVGTGRAMTPDQRNSTARQLGFDPPVTTKTGSLFNGGGGGRSGGGGGGGMSEVEQAQQRLERYTETLRRQGDVLDAEILTFGKSTAERKAAIEIARAQTDLQKLDSDSRLRITEAITAEVEANERKRQQLEKLAGAQQAAQHSAQAFTDALIDFGVEGTRAQEVAQRLFKSLARDLLNSVLAGSGPFAQAFGMKESGGLFGMLFKGISSSLFPSAKGNIFANDNLVPFAKGGAFTNSIVSSPTVFPFAKGIGLMGEAGPEAIMPLKRGPNGALGIAAHGVGGGQAVAVNLGGTHVTINGKAGADEVAALKAELDKRDRAFAGRVAETMSQMRRRGAI